MNKKITFEEIKKSQDDYSNYPITFYPLGYISKYLSFLVARFTSITPNQISLIWGMIGLFSFYLISLGGYKNMVIGILIYHFAILLDYVDGEVARAKNQTTIGGSYLDLFFNSIFRGSIMVAIGLGVYNMNGQIIYFYMGVLSCLLLLFDNINKLKVYEILISK